MSLFEATVYSYLMSPPSPLVLLRRTVLLLTTRHEKKICTFLRCARDRKIPHYISKCQGIPLTDPWCTPVIFPLAPQ